MFFAHIFFVNFVFLPPFHLVRSESAVDERKVKQRKPQGAINGWSCVSSRLKGVLNLVLIN